MDVPPFRAAQIEMVEGKSALQQCRIRGRLTKTKVRFSTTYSPDTPTK